MQLFKRISLQVFGYAFMAFGIAMIIRSELGSFPYDAISYYLVELIPVSWLTIGLASILIGVTWTILNYILIRRWQVVLSMTIVLTIGFLIDFFYYIIFGNYQTGASFIMDLIMAVVGLVIVCFSVGIVILNKSLPGAPSETTLVFLGTKIKRHWIPKLLIEGTLAVIAIVLGLLVGDMSQIGWFTILCVFGCGPMINFFNKYQKKIIGEF